MSRKALGRGLNALFSQTVGAEQDLVEISIDQIDTTSSQPRQSFDRARLEELAQSIRTNGIIQPLVVRRRGDRYQIIAGERRWRAAQLAGLIKLPCMVRDVPDDQTLEISLIENIQREELNPIEEANAYQNLLQNLKLTQEEVARRVGKDRSSITNSLRLLRLPRAIQELLENGRISMGHARALLPLESHEKQVSLVNVIIAQSLSVRETENLVKRELSTAGSPRKSSRDNRSNPNILAAQTKLAKKLGTPVKIRLNGPGGTIEIKFSSSEELSRIYDQLIRR